MGLDPALVSFVKSVEGFQPRASWDYKQNSVGYGTRAQYPGQVVDRAQAEVMLANELAKHGASVDQYAGQYGYNLGPSQRNALTSFSFNLGPGVLGRVMAQAGGDSSKIPGLLTQYVNVTDSDGTKHPLAGLISRRNAEASMFTGGPYAAYPTQTTTAQAPLSQGNSVVADIPQVAPIIPFQAPRITATPQKVASPLLAKSKPVSRPMELPDIFVQ